MDPFPIWIQDVPEVDIPVTEVEVPPHTHGGQWGIVVTGLLHLTVGGEATTYEPGETYEIPSGAEHSARLEAGTSVIDVFQDPDRYRPK